MAPQQAMDAQALEQVTTFMFRGIPRKYTNRDLVAVLERSATMDQIDFVYVPWYKNSSSNMGYAFVNFVDVTTARTVYTVMQGSQWGPAHGSRSMNLVPAQVQGLAENLKQYSLKNGLDFDLIHRPLVFKNGAQVDLQEVVERICNNTPADTLSRQTTPTTPPSACQTKETELFGVMPFGAPPGLLSPPQSAPAGFLNNLVGTPPGNFEFVHKAPLSEGARRPMGPPPGLAPPTSAVLKDSGNAHYITSPGSSHGCPVLPTFAQTSVAPALTSGNPEVEPKYVHLDMHVANDKVNTKASRFKSVTRQSEVACTGEAVGTYRDVSPACFGSGTSLNSRRSTACPSGFGSEGSDTNSSADGILESPQYAAAWQQVDILLMKLKASGAHFRKPDVTLCQ